MERGLYAPFKLRDINNFIAPPVTMYLGINTQQSIDAHVYIETPPPNVLSKNLYFPMNRDSLNIFD